MMHRKNRLNDYIYNIACQKIVFLILLSTVFVYSLMYGYSFNKLRLFDGIIICLAIYYLFYRETNINIVDFPVLSLIIGYYLIAIYKFIKEPLMSKEWDYTYYAWILPILYLLGKTVIGYKKEGFENRSFIIITAITAGLYIQGLLNYYMLLFRPLSAGLSNAFWNLDVAYTRNAWDIGFVMILGSVFYAIKVRKTRRLFSCLMISASIMAILLNICLKGRTALLIAAVIYLCMSLFYILSRDMLIIHEKRVVIIEIIIGIIVVIILICILFKNDFMGIGEIYSNSFLSRDGGVLNNVRLQWALTAIVKIFTLEKGGWNTIDDEHWITHNSWLEFGRNYDVIVFCFIISFLVVTIITDVYELSKYGKNNDLYYYAIGSKMGLIIISVINQDFYNHFDMMAILVFVCGINRGIGYANQKCEYSAITYNVYNNRFRYIAPGFGILSMALIGAAYMDWWTDRLSLLTLLIIPIVVFIIPALFSNETYQDTLIVLGCIFCSLCAVYMLWISNKNGSLNKWEYIDPFTGALTQRSSYLAFWIIPFASVVAYIVYRINLNRIIVAILTVIVSAVAFFSKIFDGRLYIIKEALKLLYSVSFKTTTDVEKELGMSLEFGNSWILSKENVTGITSSHNMWLDFARDYGIIIGGILVGFELWALYCFIKLLLNEKRKYRDYFLIISFILFNYHFMFEATGFSNRYIFVMGLFIYGMMMSNIEKT